MIFSCGDTDETRARKLDARNAARRAYQDAKVPLSRPEYCKRECQDYAEWVPRWMYQEAWDYMLAMEDAYKNMREWAEKNGVDTTCNGRRINA